RRHTSFSRDWSSDVCSSDLSGDRLREEKLTSQRLFQYLQFPLKLPLCSEPVARAAHGDGNFWGGNMWSWGILGAARIGAAITLRSEERRVGKERRARETGKG